MKNAAYVKPNTATFPWPCRIPTGKTAGSGPKLRMISLRSSRSKGSVKTLGYVTTARKYSVFYLKQLVDFNITWQTIWSKSQKLSFYLKVRTSTRTSTASHHKTPENLDWVIFKFERFVFTADNASSSVNLADSFWLTLGTNLDDNGIEFVSMIEAKDFPLWGVIFHPEKVPFEESYVPEEYESKKVRYITW